MTPRSRSPAIPVVARATTLFEYLQSSLAYLFPPVVAVFLLGMFWKRCSGTGALAGLAIGHAVSLTVFGLQRTTDLFDIHFAYDILCAMSENCFSALVPDEDIYF